MVNNFIIIIKVRIITQNQSGYDLYQQINLKGVQRIIINEYHVKNLIV